MEQICKDKNSSLTHIKWLMREDADSLVVSASNDAGSCLQIWELREKSLPVHKLLAGSEPQFFNTVVSNRKLLGDLGLKKKDFSSSFGSISPNSSIITEQRRYPPVN